MDSDGGVSFAGTVGMGLLSSQNLGQMVSQKEKELHHINTLVDDALREREAELVEANERMAKLREDFAYNLKLLEDRDAELERYDAAFLKLKDIIRDRDEELSDARVAIAELQSQLKDATVKEAEEQKAASDRITAMRLESEQAAWQAKAELRAAHEATAAVERDMQRAAHDAADKLEALKREMAAEKDIALREQDLVHKEKEDELANRVRALESEIKHKDIDAAAAAAEKAKLTALLAELEESLRTTEAELKAARADLTDTVIDKDAKINELSNNLREVEVAAANAAAEAERRARDDAATIEQLTAKLAATEEAAAAAAQEAADAQATAVAELQQELEDTVAKLTAEKDEVIATNKAAADETIARLTAELHEAQDKVRDGAAELKHAQWETQDQLKEKDRDLAAARKEAATEVAGLNKQIELHVAEIAARENELRALREKIDGQQHSLSDRAGDIAGYQAEIAAGKEREAELEQKLAQAAVDSDAALVALENELTARAQELVRDAQRARDDARSAARDLDRRLKDVTAKADEARATAAKRIEDLTTALDAATAEATEAKRALETVAARQSTSRGRLSFGAPGSPARGGSSGSLGGAATPGGVPPSPGPDGLRERIAELDETKATRALQRENERLKAALAEVESNSTKAAADAETAALRARAAELEDQNTKIRAVISQMRAEMEAMTKSPPQSQSAVEIAALEQQVAQLSAYNELLLKRNDELSRGDGSGGGGGGGGVGAAVAGVSAEELAMLRNQVRDLNDVNNHQRAELFNALSDNHRANDRIAELERALTACGDDLMTQTRRVAALEAELAAARERVAADLDLALRASKLAESGAAAAAAGQFGGANNNGGGGGGGGSGSPMRREDPRMAAMQAQIEDLKREIESAKQSAVAAQRDVELKTEVRAAVDVERATNAELRDRLADATEDIRRLMTEREKLMDLSNMLKSDLVRGAEEEATAHTVQLAASQAERSVAERYEHKFVQFEAEMEDLVQQNRALRSELDRWRSDAETQAAAPSPSHTHRASTAPYSLRRSGGEPFSLSSLGSPERPSVFGGGFDTSSSARARLEAVKESLSLAGQRTTPSPRPGSGLASERETPEQISARQRLRQIQKKRTSLIEPRRSVRNYNNIQD